MTNYFIIIITKITIEVTITNITKINIRITKINMKVKITTITNTI